MLTSRRLSAVRELLSGECCLQRSITDNNVLLIMKYDMRVEENKIKARTA